jgi:hypothetical protein
MYNETLSSICAIIVAVSIVYSECPSVDLVVYHALCMRHIATCHLWPVPVYNIFPHYPINGMILLRKLL